MGGLTASQTKDKLALQAFSKGSIFMDSVKAPVLPFSLTARAPAYHPPALIAQDTVSHEA